MQCGYCTPGWLTGTAALLARTPHADDARIDAELDGHVCRCCAYPRIRRAIHRAAELMEQPELLQPVPVRRTCRGTGSRHRSHGIWPASSRSRSPAPCPRDCSPLSPTPTARRPGSPGGPGRRLGPYRCRRLDHGVYRQGRGRPGHTHRAGVAGGRGAGGRAWPCPAGDGRHRRVAVRPRHVRQQVDAARGAAAADRGGRRFPATDRGGRGALRPASRRTQREGRHDRRPGRRAERELRRPRGRPAPGRARAIRRACHASDRVAAFGRPPGPCGGWRRGRRRCQGRFRLTCACTACCMDACCTRQRPGQRFGMPTRPPRPR